MLRVFVVSHCGISSAAPLSANFGEGMGCIGRDDGNTLVLPDPDKHISRIQAQIKCLSGEFFLIDQGGNPTSVNGRPLGKGNVASLHDGDRISMADWVLGVEVLQTPTTSRMVTQVVPSSTLGNMAVVTGGMPAFSVVEKSPPADLPTMVVETTPDAANLPTRVLEVEPWGTPVGGLEELSLEISLSEDELVAPVPASATLPSAEQETVTPQPVVPAPVDDEELAALLKGLGLTSLPAGRTLDPQLLESLGAALRVAVEGSLRLLRERASAKREVRAPQTIVVSRDNNPLKFSPDADFALQQMLATQAAGGFMPAVEALHEAFDDIYAHQIAVAQAYREAMAGILLGLRPEVLARQISVLPGVEGENPADRKARLWELYEQQHAEIMREADDAFQSAFGQEFLRAYEEQIDRLHGDRTNI